MPISFPVAPRAISQEAFAAMDYQIMRLAFDSQNSLGRLCDEEIYQNDLALRIEAAGIGTIRKEMPITVTHRDFSKSYFLDLVVGDAAVYELKATTTLIREHEAQLLNYLFLWGAQHGKLLNFRPAQVESRFVNTNLTPEFRKRFRINVNRWCEADLSSRTLRETLVSILEDWGAFLDLALYMEAAIHFLGGEEKVVHMVPLARDGIALGNQKLHLLNPETGFGITALTNGTTQYERHLSSLIRSCSLRTYQWINLNHHNIHFVTLKK